MVEEGWKRGGRRGKGSAWAGLETFVGQRGDGGVELRAVGFRGREFGLGVVKLRLEVACAVNEGSITLLRLPCSLGANAGLGFELLLQVRTVGLEAGAKSSQFDQRD